MKILLILFLLCIPTLANAEVYRVQVDVSFDNKVDAENLVALVNNIKSKITSKESTSTIPLTTIQKTASYHTCRHDENPPKQCSDYVYLNLNKEN